MIWRFVVAQLLDFHFLHSYQICSSFRLLLSNVWLFAVVTSIIFTSFHLVTNNISASFWTHQNTEMLPVHSKFSLHSSLTKKSTISTWSWSRALSPYGQVMLICTLTVSLWHFVRCHNSPLL
jgi:hypothetical protein